jgi:hypothetical protein
MTGDVVVGGVGSCFVRCTVATSLPGRALTRTQIQRPLGAPGPKDFELPGIERVNPWAQ